MQTKLGDFYKQNCKRKFGSEISKGRSKCLTEQGFEIRDFDDIYDGDRYAGNEKEEIARRKEHLEHHIVNYVEEFGIDSLISLIRLDIEIRR